MLTNYRTSIILAVTFTILLSTFWFYQDFAFIVFLSLLLQLLLKPVVDFMEVRRMPRAVASAIAIIAFILVLLALVSIISRSVLPSFQRFVAELPTIGQSLQQLPFLSDTDFVQNEFVNILDRLRSVGADLLRASLSFILVAFGKVIDFVIIIFVSFYLLKDGLTIKLWLTDLFPHTARRRVLRLFDTLLIALRVYICSQLVMCFITGLVVFAYFKLMGLPYASVFALLSGISEFIPVLGPTVASALGILMTASAMRELTVQTALFSIPSPSSSASSSAANCSALRGCFSPFPSSSSSRSSSRTSIATEGRCRVRRRSDPLRESRRLCNNNSYRKKQMQ